MKLDVARVTTLRMLDDPDGQRWSKPAVGTAFDPANEVDMAIQSAAIECVSSYVHGGGDFFDVVQEIQTDADGTFSFQSLGSAIPPPSSTLPNVPLFIQLSLIHI